MRKMRVKRHKWAYISLAVLAISFTVWLVDRYWIRGDVTLFETPGWRTTGQLLLRLDKPGSDILLLALQADAPDPALPKELVSVAPESVIYRYNRARDTLDPVGKEVWENASGPVSVSLEQYRPSNPKGGIGIDTRELILEKRGQMVPTAGKAALCIEAPSQKSDFAAVLSAARRKGKPFIPFLSGPYGVGQHYHQIFSLPDLEAIGRPVRLPLKADISAIQMMWAPERRYVVYTDLFFTQLCIVPVDVLGMEKP